VEWKTRLTELLGCKYPILEGAFAGFGNWQFAAAVANTGAYGLITAGTSRTPEQLREDIKKCRAATDGAFGVNLSIGLCPRIEEMLEVCIEEKVDVETAVYKPDSLAPRIKESGVKWIHKSARVRDAQYAESLGADAVIVVGLEGVGFKNPEQLPTFTTTTWGTKMIKVPFIAAGGIGDAHGFLAALAMGADGIMMGTAFMATNECPTNEASKLAMVKSEPDNPRIRNRVIPRSDPQKYAEVLKLRDKLPLNEWLPMLERTQPTDPERDATDKPDSDVTRVGSLAIGAIDKVSTCQELVDSIIQGAEKIIDSWEFLKTR